MKKFPEGFLFGAATSAHQVEGDLHNDWTEWEKENAIRLAREATQKLNYLQNWDAIKEIAANPEKYISGKAADHYSRYEEDFKIAKELGHNATRLSIEWSRVEPEEGKFDENEIEHYKRVIQKLLELDIEPFVTLWHWPIPIWLRNIGGWQNKKITNYFVRYVEKMVTALPDVKFWITLNEPELWANKAYMIGDWPPQKRNPFIYWRVLQNLIKVHTKAYGVIKKINPHSSVGIAKNNVYFEAYKNKFINRLLKRIFDCWWNFYFLNKINNHHDFIGLNHYFHHRINYGFNKNENKKVSDMGWELYPEGLYYALKEVSRYKKPIYITENGLADAHDTQRAWFITEYLKNVLKAIDEGVDVRGYLHWSLLDNFEWDKGFWPRFGLVEVDYKTYGRQIRESAFLYKKIIEQGL